MQSTMNETSKGSDLAPSRRRIGRTRQEAALARGGTREALIRAGLELVTERGFHASGIEEVLKRADVPKGSFYHYFPSKQTFVDEVIRSYAGFSQHRLDRTLGNKDRAPLDRIRDFVEDGKRGMKKYQFTRGCLIGTLGQELAGVDEYFREKVEGVMSSWDQPLTACLQEAVAQGALSTDADLRALSRFFWTGWEGAIMRAKLRRSGEPLDQFVTVFLSLLTPKGSVLRKSPSTSRSGLRKAKK